MKVTPKQQLGFLARSAFEITSAVVAGYMTDPGTSDLDDEQPIYVSMTLGDYRNARRLNVELLKMQ